MTITRLLRPLYGCDTAKLDLTSAMRAPKALMAHTQAACESYTTHPEAQQELAPGFLAGETTQAVFDTTLTPFDRRMLRAAGIAAEVLP